MNSSYQHDYESKYNEQLKLNKQLIDQVKSLKGKMEIQKSQISQDYEDKVYRLIQQE